MTCHIAFFTEGYLECFIGPFDTPEEADFFIGGSYFGSDLFSGDLQAYIMERDADQYHEDLEEEFSMLRMEWFTVEERFRHWKEEQDEQD